MTSPPERPRETWDEAIARGVASFYATGGWTAERRARMRPFFDLIDARLAAEQAATEATPRVAA